jgi:hypothetical protein
MVGGIENRGESMRKTRKSHPSNLKAKVAIGAIKAHKTAAQIAQMFGIDPKETRLARFGVSDRRILPICISKAPAKGIWLASNILGPVRVLQTSSKAPGEKEPRMCERKLSVTRASLGQGR